VTRIPATFDESDLDGDLVVVDLREEVLTGDLHEMLDFVRVDVGWIGSMSMTQKHVRPFFEILNTVKGEVVLVFKRLESVDGGMRQFLQFELVEVLICFYPTKCSVERSSVVSVIRFVVINMLTDEHVENDCAKHPMGVFIHNVNRRSK